MQGNITKNFTWEEATYTNTGINNTIDNEVVKLNVEQLAKSILQPLRDALNIPIKINSWYRNSKVNAAVGGSVSSQHMLGEAADISCNDMLGAFNYIKDNLLFDQLIWETKGSNNWIHVSYKRLGKNRNQVLIATFDKKSNKMVYKPYKN